VHTTALSPVEADMPARDDSRDLHRRHSVWDVSTAAQARAPVSDDKWHVLAC